LESLADGENDAFASARQGEEGQRGPGDGRRQGHEALDGVPEETRDPLPDGTTKYSRPLPGAARMYPETDVPPTPVTRERMEEIRANLPEFPEEIERRLMRDHGLNAQQARQIVRQSKEELFVRIAEEFNAAQVAATMFLNTYSEIERDGADPDSVSDETVMEIFRMLGHGRFAKEAIPSILREAAAGRTPEEAVGILGLEAVDAGEAEAVIRSIVMEREEFVRSKGAAAAGPLMGPVMEALRGKIDGRKASEILAEEIRKIV
jgi:glutamyl-tRNA(Gln) amidotransferase subunit E